MKVTFTIRIWKEGKMYVSYAPEFDVSSCGYTKNKARKNIIEAVALFQEVQKELSATV